MNWRRRAALGVIALWLVVGLARLSRLVEPAEAPPGQELAPLLDALRSTIPPASGYLYVLPGEFGTDTGTGPRLRYELYPRRYDDIRAAQDEATVRGIMRSEGLSFIVVPDASQYPAGHWLRQPRDWLRPVPLGPNAYVLEASP